MNVLTIYGANGHAKVVAEAFLSQFPKGKINFYDDDTIKVSCLEIKVNHNTAHIHTPENSLIVAVGNNLVRKSIVEKLGGKINNIVFMESLQHTTAHISRSAQLGFGTFIATKAVVNAEVTIGKHVIINTASIVEHDCKIEDFVHIGPGALLAGNVEVGEGTFVGLGAKVIQGVKIGKWCTIGAGCVVLNDIPDGTTVVGVPGKIITK
tara:strand:- start:505 stop:1128 length:624 start_codon:yes stop_codon:yes gene_type:complete